MSDNPIEAMPPACLAEMLAAAEAMAGRDSFLRVDFYCENGALKFGEYCHYRGSGLDPFTPDSLDLKPGALWTQSV